MSNEKKQRLSIFARWRKLLPRRPEHTPGDLPPVLALLKWLLIASAVGLIVGAVSSLFGHALIWVGDLRASCPWLVFGLPLGGLLIVLLYRVCKNTADRGTNTVISSVQESAHIPFKMAPLIFISTVITHLFGGSAGREGAALQLGGSIAGKLGETLRLKENDRHTIILCGMSAGFSALFGTPMAAAIFAMEVISVGIMRYSALVPCVTAAMIAQFVAKFFQVPPETFLVTGLPTMTVAVFFKLVVFAAVAGLVSILFCLVLHKVDHLYEKFFKNPYVRILMAGVLVMLLSLIPGNSIYLGSGMGIIEGIFHGHGDVQWYAFLLKMLFTALTLGAGFKGGEIVPSFCIGAAFGCTVASLLGLPVELVAACGMVGVFCGVTNCPITSLLIAFELFGYEGMPYFLVTIAVSYLLSGYSSLYSTQKIVWSKTQADLTHHSIQPE